MSTSLLGAMGATGSWLARVAALCTAAGRPAALASLLAAAGGIATAQEITVTHQQGETVLPAPPERVIVQDFAVLDILDAMGVEPIGLPGANLPTYLSKYAADDYIRTGTLQEPDYEAIHAAAPDLMIVAGRSRTSYPQLSRMVPTIDLSADNADIRVSVQDNITRLGEIFGREARAEEMNAELEAKFDALRTATADAGTAIVLVTNAGRLGVYGPNSRMSWIFSEAGFRPVIEDIDDRFHGGDVVSFEFILETNPDWLFVVDRDAGVGGSGGAAAALLDNALVAQTTAWQEGQVVYLDPVPAYVVMHGFTSVSTLIDQVIAAVEDAG